MDKIQPVDGVDIHEIIRDQVSILRELGLGLGEVVDWIGERFEQDDIEIALNPENLSTKELIAKAEMFLKEHGSE